MPQLKIDYTGQKIGNRLVLGLSHFTEHNDPMWKVICVCGNSFLSLTQDLKRKYCRECKGGIKRKRPYETVYNAFVQKATKRGHSVQITYEEFIRYAEVSTCHYCEDSISWTEYQTSRGHLLRGRLAYNLDRKNNSQGYSLENCVVCCGKCNLSKGDRFAYDEWVEIGKTIKKLREETNASKK